MYRISLATIKTRREIGGGSYERMTLWRGESPERAKAAARKVRPLNYAALIEPGERATLCVNIAGRCGVLYQLVATQQIERKSDGHLVAGVLEFYETGENA